MKEDVVEATPHILFNGESHSVKWFCRNLVATTFEFFYKFSREKTFTTGNNLPKFDVGRTECLYRFAQTERYCRIAVFGARISLELFLYQPGQHCCAKDTYNIEKPTEWRNAARGGEVGNFAAHVNANLGCIVCPCKVVFTQYPRCFITKSTPRTIIRSCHAPSLPRV